MKGLYILISVIVTVVVMFFVGIYSLKVTNVENGLITIEIFGQSVDYYFEK